MILEITIHKIGELGLKSLKQVKINSMCTVFAESEVISLRAQGIDKADIASGLQKRIVSMVSRLGVKLEIAFVGGVAKNRAVKFPGNGSKYI